MHGRVIRIGREALWCLLARRGVTFQRTRTWRESPDPERKRTDRVPAAYHRTHGARYCHGCYSVGDDRLWGVNRRKKGAVNTLWPR